jgi:hypothetical protein
LSRHQVDGNSSAQAHCLCLLAQTVTAISDVSLLSKDEVDAFKMLVPMRMKLLMQILRPLLKMGEGTCKKSMSHTTPKASAVFTTPQLCSSTLNPSRTA